MKALLIFNTQAIVHIIIARTPKINKPTANFRTFGDTSKFIEKSAGNINTVKAPLVVPMMPNNIWIWGISAANIVMVETAVIERNNRRLNDPTGRSFPNRTQHIPRPSPSFEIVPNVFNHGIRDFVIGVVSEEEEITLSSSDEDWLLIFTGSNQIRRSAKP
jgi:hypothetical protein